MYEAEITFHQGSEREFTYEGIFKELDDAIAFIEHQAQGQMSVRAWINNKEVKVRNGKVIDRDGEPFCSNPVWHELFAYREDSILPLPTADVLMRVPNPAAAQGPRVSGMLRECEGL